MHLTDGTTKTVDLPNTTHNRHFIEVDLGEFQLEEGTERLKFSFTHPDYLNVDWIQLDPVSPDENHPGNDGVSAHLGSSHSSLRSQTGAMSSTFLGSSSR